MDGAGCDGGLDAAGMRMVSCRETAVGEDEECGTAHGRVAMPFEGVAEGRDGRRPACRAAPPVVRRTVRG
ncbi:putative uncharacterized protein [Streptomyces azureus]|uniref:Uncharacterized protein n=1 Tax=Streptomyces azureus TaxID=146537 RepID=A0A0K8PCX9_STRAJ|nr:putative uncharacterized protein [Streptomyces azureus]